MMVDAPLSPGFLTRYCTDTDGLLSGCLAEAELEITQTNRFDKIYPIYYPAGLTVWDGVYCVRGRVINHRNGS